MIRHLKVLGLALVAVFAIGAAAASAATAQETQGELFDDNSMSLDVTELAGKSNALTAFGSEVECPGSTWTGHKYNATPHEAIPSGSTTATVTPTYVNCVARDGTGTHKATVTTNECDYVLHFGETTGVESKYSVTTDLACSEGKDIQVEVYPFSGSELGGVACTMTLKSQTGLSGPALTSNTAAHDLEVKGTFNGVSIERSGPACATESTSKGEWHVNATVKGTNVLGEETGVKVSD
jgi:hypothetical protein